MSYVAAALPLSRPRRAFGFVDTAPLIGLIAFAGVLDLPQWREHAGLTAALLAAAVSVPLLWRRRYPFVVFCAVSGAVIPVAQLNIIPYPCVGAELLAAYSLAAYGRRWWVSLTAIIAFAAAVTATFRDPLPPIPDVVGPLLLMVLPWLAGNGIRLRQQRVDVIETRALALERERDEARRTLLNERTRIARELHDVVAHTVSVMIIQAGAARQVMRSKPDRAATALTAVEDCGREALGELRHLLGLLNEPDESPLTPQPSLEALPSMVDRVIAAGLPVSMRIEGERRRLSPGVDLAGYRIVQEALTNALKHSGRAATEVVLTYGVDELGISVVDEGRTTQEGGSGHGGGGRGLLGMRERVALYGGTMDAGARPGGGYALRVRLPVGT